ncbi:putative GNAT superfamily acetyltransferase [Catenulispora sp. GP43]|uniref:GNAT family N-acetyltransferase n=1 Tax=Catenulispora sp. GP43 TaxID=3156263 RepID=UPI003514638B
MSTAQNAHTQARKAAEATAVTIRELTEPKEHDAATDVINRIWSLEPGQSLMPSGLMRVMAYEGCYVAGVFDDEDGGRMIGAATGFLASDGDAGGIHLHSHIAGVLPEADGRRAGFALKLHQRAWALSHSIGRITWTFDPLVRGNAYFNMAKLGAQAAGYLVDFYGENMRDGVNAGQGSDRLLMNWVLDAPRVVAAASGQRVAEPELERLLDAGRAVLSDTDVAHGTVADTVAISTTASATSSTTSAPNGPGPLLCATPAAIHTLRREAPEQARAWRSAVRGALTEAIADGYHITGFTRSGWYLLDFHEPDQQGERDL